MKLYRSARMSWTRWVTFFIVAAVLLSLIPAAWGAHVTVTHSLILRNHHWVPYNPSRELVRGGQVGWTSPHGGDCGHAVGHRP